VVVGFGGQRYLAKAECRARTSDRAGALSGAAKSEPGFAREKNIILRSLGATSGEALHRLKLLGGQGLLFESSAEFFGLSEISI
jgi:hypothetical protein